MQFCPDWAFAYKCPIDRHRLNVAIRRLLREQVAAKDVKVANGLGQTIERVKVQIPLGPEAEVPLDICLR
jgi:hypothetical protein